MEYEITVRCSEVELPQLAGMVTKAATRLMPPAAVTPLAGLDLDRMIWLNIWRESPTSPIYRVSLTRTKGGQGKLGQDSISKEVTVRQLLALGQEA